MGADQVVAVKDCVSDKIPKLIDEGYSQEQAVAIAYSMCEGRAWDDLAEDERGDVLATYAQRSSTVRQLGENRIGGYGVVFGTPEERDLYGDYFTAQTDFWLDEYKDQPVIYDHALGALPLDMPQDTPRRAKLGRVVKALVDTVGVWIEAVIEDHNEWVQAVLSLIDQGVMHWSSGSVPHLVEYAPDNQILSWPVVEMSVTPTPAEPRKTGIVRLRHFVNPQDAPEARQSEAARHHAPDEYPSPKNSLQEGPTMTLNINAEALVWALAEQAQDQFKAVVDAYKQGNAIAEMLAPMADELATIAGTDAETAQQVLIEFVAQHATGQAAPPEPDVSPEDESMPAMLNGPDVQKMIDQGVQKALQARLNRQPDGALLTPKQKGVNVQPRKASPEMTLARYVRAIRDGERDKLDDLKEYHRGTFKAMGINPDTAGGYLVPPAQGSQIIEELEASAVVLPLCQEMPMPESDTLDIPTDDGGVTAYWVAENAQITSADNTFGQRKLVARKLAALVKVSNELLESSNPSVDAFLRAKIARKLALKIDESILQGSGVGEEPLGLSNYPATVTKTALNAAPTMADVIDMISRIEVEDVAVDPMWYFVFNPRDKATLAKVQDTTSGDFLWQEYGMPGQTMVGGYPATLRGYPYVTTSQITIDTDDNNETQIYFGQFNDVIVGMHKSIELMASNVAGTSFEYNQTWIRAIMRLDWVLAHNESIEILTDVRTS